MGIPRRDVRFKVDDDVHADLVACANADGVDIAEFVEQLVKHEVGRRFSAAMMLLQHRERSGTSGNNGEGRA